MRKIIFEDDEMRVISMFDTSNREAALTAVGAVIPLTREDTELSAVVVSTVEKLKQISDADFMKLDFEGYRLEGEEDKE
ncbi:MAG: transposon-transfer assisting family protein [Lachnospiraceae bacterium]|uniref:Uncharacterized protein n=1 Tax=Porcincola intestinalis TaxID=2606632 RepID=A0A6L5X629_9FIRM|nr:transposon-transfer assisting family protein [Porcincola intestinalis]MCI6767116.1 transposon-transfer assisting family protein [Lachnospiraceae bacterium]MSS13812.1 hypothetical protein [Porcincola intestinalis]